MEKQLLLTEFRALEDNKIRARVNDYSLSKELRGNNGKFREQISKEVWQRAIDKASDVNVYINHQPYVDIMENMELRAEDDGVYLYGTLSDKAKGVYKAIQDKVINGVSFGFRALKDSFKNASGYLERTIEDMELIEVSLLDVEPAYFGTNVEARSLDLPTEDVKRKRLELLKTF